jgi:hypothetical protein
VQGLKPFSLIKKKVFENEFLQKVHFKRSFKNKVLKALSKTKFLKD